MKFEESTGAVLSDYKRHRPTYIGRIIISLTLLLVVWYGNDARFYKISWAFLALSVLWGIIVETRINLDRLFPWNTYLRTFSDIALFTALIYLTGGIHSFFTTALIFATAANSLKLTRTSGLYTIFLCISSIVVMNAMLLLDLIPAVNLLASPVSKINLVNAIASPILLLFALFTIHQLIFSVYSKLNKERSESNRLLGEVHIAKEQTEIKKEEVELAQRETLKQKQETEELNRLIKSLNEELNLKHIMQKVARYVNENFRINHYALYSVNSEKTSISLLEANFPDSVSNEDRNKIINFQIPINGEKGSHAFTIRTKRPFFIHNAQNVQRIEKNTEEEIFIIRQCNLQSTLFLPLILNNEPIGILDFSNAMEKMEIAKSDIIRLSILGEQLAGIIHGSNLFKQVQEEREKALAAQKEAEAAKQLAEEARRQSDKLLFNILPEKIARELKETGAVESLFYDRVSIMFTDFIGFTQSVTQMLPDDLIMQLDGIFSQFDLICERRHIEKIKTIGDAYMCAGGVPDYNFTHFIDICLVALEMRNFMIETKKTKESISGEPFWDIRIGIHSGAVMAGVIGNKKFGFDLWGDDVNIAARMESSSEPQKINISGDTYELVKDYFVCFPRGLVSAKGKGDIPMYFLERLKPEYSFDADGIVPNSILLGIYDELRRGMDKI